MNEGGGEWMPEEMNVWRRRWITREWLILYECSGERTYECSGEWTYESSSERTYEWTYEWPRRRWISEALMNSHLDSHLDYHCYLSFSCSFSCSFLRSFSYWYKVLREYPHFCLVGFLYVLITNLTPTYQVPKFARVSTKIVTVLRLARDPDFSHFTPIFERRTARLDSL